MHQRFAEFENNPINTYITELQETIKWLQINYDPLNAEVSNLLEEIDYPFSEDIRMLHMPPRLKLPDWHALGLACSKTGALPNWHTPRLAATS